MRKIAFIDTETTGVDHSQCGVHQVAIRILCGNILFPAQSFRIRPKDDCLIIPEALLKCNVTEEQIMSYIPMAQGYKDVCTYLEKFVDPYANKKKYGAEGMDKLIFSGYNSPFDTGMIRQWFDDNKTKDFNMYGAYFGSNSDLDIKALAMQKLLDRLFFFFIFQLMTVAKELGFKIDPNKAHDAEYDINVTVNIYCRLVGITPEVYNPDKHKIKFPIRVKEF